ncbi:MAG: hypothetical protein IKL56_03085 [Bacteroidaceae bacterium]|nr:hypothetical protein [Bacteroidaceae bacterium]
MKKKVLYIISLVLLLQISAATAQNVILNAKLDTFAMRIGEQTRARLELSIDSGYNVVLPELEKEKLVEGIEILESKEYSQNVDGGRKNYIQEYLITSFDSTRYEIPPFEVVVDKDTFASNRLILDVYSVEIDTANINNIAGPAEVVDVQLTWEEFRDAIYLAIILILVAVALVMTTISLVKNKPIIRIVKVKPKLPSHVIAINRIDEIRNNESLSAEGNEKEYYTQLTDVLREYMHDRFGIDAQEMTTSEIIDELLKIKDKESIKELKDILEVADLVKFAKMKPDERENRLNMTNAIEFVNETKNAEEHIVQPTEVKIVNERSLLHKRVLIAAVVILAVIVLGVIFLLTTDLYNMFS